MEVHVRRKTTRNIYKTSILQQTAFWSEVKRKQGIGTKAFDLKIKASDLYDASNSRNYVVDDLLVLFQSIGGGCKIGYVPYGPTVKPEEENQGVFLEELSESLRPCLPPECVALRYDLLWESLWTKDEAYFNCDGHWMGPPEKVYQEIRLNYETQNWNLKKANTNILPSDTIFIDLKKDENTLLREMKPKSRYNVRLSMRKGVHVREGSIDDLGIWYSLYQQTCRRNRLYLHDPGHFRAVLGTNADHCGSPAEVEFLIAEIDRRPLAAIFLVYSGKRATYLYGASSSTDRHFMAPHALQWEAIRRARRRGCSEYDMFGVAPHPDPSHPLYGLYRFKTGFGGSLFHRMGCWDYPLRPDDYDTYLTAEMKSQGYHLN